MKIWRNVRKYYAVKFHQKISVENDPTNHCRIYPNDRFKTYDDCDADFIRRILEASYPSGFLPVWATNDSSKVTTKVVGKDEAFKNKSIPYTHIVSGSAENDCPLPCTTTQITGVFWDEKPEDNEIDITFSSIMTITRNVFPKFEVLFGGLGSKKQQEEVLLSYSN